MTADDMLMTVTVKRSPGGLMAMMRAKCIARYKLHTVPGRPEELEENQGPLNPITVDDRPSRTTPQTTVWNDPKHYLPGRVISFGYIHGSVRIRQHGGERNREWVDTRDITFRDGWLDKVWEYLDPFFGHKPLSSGAEDLLAVVRSTGMKMADVPTPEAIRLLTTGRPIRDDPQA